MGNEKSNSYWEVKLPPNYDRVGIENFIRAQYVIRASLMNLYLTLYHFSVLLFFLMYIWLQL